MKLLMSVTTDMRIKHFIPLKQLDTTFKNN